MATKERVKRERNSGIIHARVGDDLKQMAEEIAADQRLDITNWLRVVIQAEHKKLKAKQAKHREE